MAATTLATLLATVKDRTMAVLLHNLFAVPDPVAAMIPMELAGGGYKYTQEYVNDPGADAAYMALYDTMTASAMTTGSYDGFMHYAYNMDDDPILLSPEGQGQQGYNRKEEKKKRILTGISNTYRADMYSAEEATYTYGATIQALFGVAYDFEWVSPGTQFTFENVHARTGVTTVNHGFKWTQASLSLQYMAPGDTAYGPAVVLSATNYYKVALYSGGTTGAANYAKSCRVTVTYATISATGDYDSSTLAGVNDYIVATPNKKPNGFLWKVSPERHAFDSLNFVSGTNHATNPTAAGAASDEDNLNWLTTKLLDGANGNASRCVICCDEVMQRAVGAVIRALGQKWETYNFMGRQFHDLNFGGIRIQRCPGMPTGTSPNAAVTTRYMLGLILGEDGCKIKYSLLNTDRTMANLVAKLTGNQNVADPAGTRNLPISYYETLAAANTLVANQIGVMGFDPAVGGMDKAVLLSNLTA